MKKKTIKKPNQFSKLMNLHRQLCIFDDCIEVLFKNDPKLVDKLRSSNRITKDILFNRAMVLTIDDRNIIKNYIKFT